MNNRIFLLSSAVNHFSIQSNSYMQRTFTQFILSFIVGFNAIRRTSYFSVVNESYLISGPFTVHIFILFICFLNSVLLLCWALYFYTILLNSIQNWYRPYFRRFLNIIFFSFSLVESIFLFSTTTKQIRNSIILFQLLCLRNMLMWFVCFIRPDEILTHTHDSTFAITL